MQIDVKSTFESTQHFLKLITEYVLLTEPREKKVAIKPLAQHKPKEFPPPHTITEKSNEVLETQNVTNTGAQKVNGISEKTLEVEDNSSFIEFTPSPLIAPTVRDLELSRPHDLNLCTSQSSRFNESSKLDRTQKRTVEELLADVSNNLGGSFVENSVFFEPGWLF